MALPQYKLLDSQMGMTESQRGRLNLLKRKEKDGKIVDSEKAELAEMAGYKSILEQRRVESIVAKVTADGAKQHENTVSAINKNTNDKLDDLKPFLEQTMVEVMTGKISSSALDGCSEIQKRNFFLEAARNNQSIANVHAAEIADDKFEKKCLTMNPAALEQNRKTTENLLEKRQKDRDGAAKSKQAAEAQKASAKEKAEAQKASAKEKAAAKKAAKGKGSSKRKAIDPEMALVEAETDAELKRVNNEFNLACSSKAVGISSVAETPAPETEKPETKAPAEVAVVADVVAEPVPTEPKGKSLVAVAALSSCSDFVHGLSNSCDPLLCDGCTACKGN